MTFSGSTVDADINVKVVHQEVKCAGEPITVNGATISFSNITNDGDCMGDALRGQKKDVSKYVITENDDGSLSFHSDGYPTLKLNKK